MITKSKSVQCLVFLSLPFRWRCFSTTCLRGWPAAFGLLVFCLMPLVSGAEDEDTGRLSVESLSSTKAVISQYSKMETLLLERAKRQFADPSVSAAKAAETVQALGTIRSRKAVPFLVDNLTSFSTYSIRGPDGKFINVLAGMGKRYPAYQSLLVIGMPFDEALTYLDKIPGGSFQEAKFLHLMVKWFGEAFVEYAEAKTEKSGRWQHIHALIDKYHSVPENDLELPPDSEIQGIK